MKRKNNKGQMAIVMIAVLVVGILIAGYFLGAGNLFSSGSDGDNGNEGTWDAKLVYFKINSKNFHTSSSVDPSFEIYSEKPGVCWENPRETTCSEQYVGAYSSSSGTATIQDLHPGTYYAIAILSGQYTEYFTIVIPDEPQTSTQSLSDYNNQPDSHALSMKTIDSSLATSNATFTISATASNKEYTLTESFTIADDKCVKLWKARIYETNKSLTDYDGSTTYEGIKEFKVSFNGGTLFTLVNIPSGITSGFNADGIAQYSDIDLSSQNIEVCDGKGLEMKTYIKANVNSTSVNQSNDYLLGPAEIVSKIKLYDTMGSQIPSSDYIYVQGASA